MKLIDEIIEILSSEEPNITNALIKTKVLLFRLGEKDLTKWVNNELNGYESNDDIPPYRVAPAVVEANSMNIAYSVNSHEVPTYHLKDDLRDSIEKVKFGNSIAALESLVAGDKKTSGVRKKIPMVYYGLLSEKLASDYKIQEAWSSVSNNSLVQILTEVRSRLLDFILELEDKIPDKTTETELKGMSKSIDAKSLFNHTVIGDNATILLGDNNTQTINNSIVKNDLESLTKYFKENQVSEKDIKILEDAISSDKNLVNYQEKTYGPKVKEWVVMMLTKAVETTWNIEIGVASSLIATGLNSFYGWF